MIRQWTSSVASSPSPSLFRMNSSILKIRKSLFSSSNNSINSNNYNNNNNNNISDNEEPTIKILKHALHNHVALTGWTRDSLARAAIDLGYPATAHGLVLGDAGLALTSYFVQQSTRHMTRQVLDMESEWEKLKVTQKIRTTCQIRLKLLIPYIHKWPEALAVMALPQNAPTSLSNLTHLIDEMWYLAGDSSVDMNWYSKRALLAAVYTSSEWYMTTDHSLEYSETFKFLDRRLQDTAVIGKTSAQMRNVVDFGLRSIKGVLESKGILK